MSSLHPNPNYSSVALENTHKEHMKSSIPKIVSDWGVIITPNGNWYSLQWILYVELYQSQLSILPKEPTRAPLCPSHLHAMTLYCPYNNYLSTYWHTYFCSSDISLLKHSVSYVLGDVILSEIPQARCIAITIEVFQHWEESLTRDIFSAISQWKIS